jgi:CheY-like chemotaxis protein
MPLILAIEPDRRQATQLKAAVRGRLRAELVLADSAEAALAALGDRVPDLVLTSAFLSPKDETALAERLRALDAAAAHVQTLTIPVLDAPRRPSNGGRGMLSVLLGDRAHTPAAPDGCDPAVFADQCAAYLERAAHEHTHQVTVDEAASDPFVPIEEPAADQPEPQIAAQEIEAGSDQPAPPGAFELDLSALLDEAVVHELSAAIENVTATEPDRWLKPRSKPRAETWTAMPLGNKALWPRMDGVCAEPLAPPKVSDASVRPKNQTPSRRPKRTPKAKPLQDAWGFFDPAQCGFATLLAKLDEITEVASPLPTDNPSAGPLDVSR